MPWYSSVPLLRNRLTVIAAWLCQPAQSHLATSVVAICKPPACLLSLVLRVCLAQLSDLAPEGGVCAVSPCNPFTTLRTSPRVKTGLSDLARPLEAVWQVLSLT